MNRKIKFRALKDDMSNCTFQYGELVYDAIGEPRITHKDFSGKGLQFNSCIKGTEGQFTGLYDKNGKEVYEGDVIKYKQHHFNSEHISEKIKAVQWKYDRWGIYETHAGESDIEVIGNIYQNPELL